MSACFAFLYFIFILFFLNFFVFFVDFFFKCVILFTVKGL